MAITTHFSSSASSLGVQGRSYSFEVVSAFTLAALVFLASLVGVLNPGIYAKETASIRAQSIGQDWVNLVVLVPFLAVTGAQAYRGSRRAQLLLGGAFAFTIYNYAIYAFGIHFNALFLVYCAALGFSTFGFATLLFHLKPEDVKGWYEARFPRKWTGMSQIVIALAFAALWLSDIVPAIARGVAPSAVSNDLLFTNPVHVLDLSLALPALMFSGVQLLRGRSSGYVFSPMLMTLSVLMAVAIGGMTLTSIIAHQPTEVGVLSMFAAIAIACGAVLVALLRRIRER